MPPDALFAASPLTRQLPRPHPGQMPEPRTPGAVWLAWGPDYTLMRGQAVVARISVVDEDMHATSHPMPLHIADYVCADIAALSKWLAKGGR